MFAPALTQVVAAAVAVAVAVVVVVVGVVLVAVAVAAAGAMASPSPRCASSAAGSAGQRLLHHTKATLYCAYLHSAVALRSAVLTRYR